MNANPKTKIILTCVFLIVLGALALFMGIKAMQTNLDEYKKTNAIVSDVDIHTTTDADGISTDEYQVYVDYEVDGKEYNHIYYTSDSNYNEGDEIEILYHPENPEKLATGNEKTSGLIFTIVGAALIIGGGVYAVVGFKKLKNN